MRRPALRSRRIRTLPNMLSTVPKYFHQGISILASVFFDHYREAHVIYPLSERRLHRMQVWVRIPPMAKFVFLHFTLFRAECKKLF